MDDQTREKYLKIALVVFGGLALLIYPLGLIWPSGWIWHGGQGNYYLQMICGIYAVLGVFLIAAARNPATNRRLIAFTIWSSVVHAAIMAAQAVSDPQEHGHLVGDVPALLVLAAVLWLLSPKGERFIKGIGQS
jgi:DNA-binding helix-hairpin-helix protein with protein kinase domain